MARALADRAEPHASRIVIAPKARGGESRCGPIGHRYGRYRSYRRYGHGTGAGFSLIEMLVAVAILGLVGSAGLFAVGNRDPATLKREANEVAMLINRTRFDAVRTSRETVVRYDAGRHAVVADHGDRRLPRSVALHVEPGGRRGFDIVFSPAGTSRGLFARLSAGEDARWLTVDPLTGRVAVHAGDPREAP